MKTPYWLRYRAFKVEDMRFTKVFRASILPLTRSSDLYFTRNDLISMEEAQEITFDIFGILLNFCVFLIFLEIPQILKPLIG